MDGDSAEIGLAFETYVLSKFDLKPYKSRKKTVFQIVSWTGDYGKNVGYKVETDSEPDLIIRHRESNFKIAVECKYRSHLSDGKINLGYKSNLTHYRDYASDNPNIPTYIVFGLEGQPDNPDKIYCVPIEYIKYVNSYINYFNDYTHNSEDMFSFDPITRILK